MVLRFVALAVLIVACGGLGVEQYRQGNVHTSLRITRIVPCQMGMEPVRFAFATESACLGETLAGAGDIVQVQRLQSDSNNAVLVLILSERGQARMSAITVDSRFAVVARGQVVAAPHVQNALDSRELYLRTDVARLDRMFALTTE